MLREKGGGVTETAVLLLYRYLLPRILDSNSVVSLLELDLNNGQIKKIQDLMGQSLLVITGSLCGHYQLDLSSELDRFTAIRLVGGVAVAVVVGGGRGGGGVLVVLVVWS